MFGGHFFKVPVYRKIAKAEFKSFHEISVVFCFEMDHLLKSSDYPDFDLFSAKFEVFSKISSPTKDTENLGAAFSFPGIWPRALDFYDFFGKFSVEKLAPIDEVKPLYSVLIRINSSFVT